MNDARVRFVAVLAVATLVLSGCAAPVADPTPNEWRWPEDPQSDRIGWEAGYWYNESVAVNQSDGLNASEREAFVARTAARVERIRGLEFEESVEVDVMSRAEYRDQSSGDGGAGPGWNDQVWEALLLIGEDRTVEAAFDDLYGDAVLGYYSPSEERIVVVSDAENPVIDRATLSHELMHALQYQRFDIGGVPQTLDGRLAEDGLVEGDARYVEQLYEERCGDEWDCVRRPETNPNRENFDAGVYLTVYAPYSDGPTFVHSLRERGGWTAVNEAYARPPASTEQLVHPEAYPEDRPRTVAVPNRSNGAWSRFDRHPVGNTVGEAPIFVMLYRHGAIPSSALERNAEPYSRYNYSSNASDGWAGDTVVPYRSDDGEFGYVWAIEWETAADAEEFVSAYETALREGLNATRTAPNTYVVADGPYADAFRVTRNGTRVTVVNAPTTDRLDGVHAPGR
ncbi:Hvo_1808 family surface protein [Halopelagius longus]|uniref:Lipoprotein n=1 Tax=Halopelagius longus TaxID=1236180 RepID=A0A1H0XQ50_9EURY|nr:Hvo_1808 family surface protein [Halopelagius longus]RDI72015.1 hypothetical protein DWB78_09940 [Halopelagius longus]SDQ05064.1 hypothetical protein SAMN05216278_0093 [Halopelagius longus]